MLLFVSKSSARTFGGARSTVSSLGLRPLDGTTARVPVQGGSGPTLAMGQTIFILNHLRGGSSLGGSGSGGGGGRSGGGPFGFRPTPKKTADPFGKSKEPESKFGRNANRAQQEDQQQQQDEKGEEGGEEEYVKEMIDTFLTRGSRNSFIARVYAILSAQLLFTALTCILFGTYPPLTNIYVMSSITGQASPYLFIPLAGVLLSTIAWFRIAVSPKARQKSPNKWWWLTIFTVGEAVSIGAISSLYKLRSVVTAMFATALAAVTVSMYTISQQNSKYDLSQWGATLSSWATILLVYLLLGLAQEVGLLPFGFLPYSDMLYSIFATFLFSLFLAYHTKLIVGGKHAKYRMNENDYVFGAMALYVDIVNIFLNILQLMGEERDRN